MKYFGIWSKMLCWFHRDSSVFWARLVTIQLTYFVVNKMVQTRHKRWTGNDDLDWTALLLCMSFTWSLVQILVMRDNIALLAFHTFLVHPYEAKIESGINYIFATHAFVIVTLRLGVGGSSGSPAIKDVRNYLSHKLPIIRTYLVEVSPAKDGGLGGGLSNK